MNNRTLKTGRALVSLALVLAASITAIPASTAAGLPSARLVSPSYDATNSVDATGDIAQQEPRRFTLISATAQSFHLLTWLQLME